MLDTPRTEEFPSLDALGNVAPNYQHYPKTIVSGPGLPLTDAYLKWYDLHRADAPTPDAIKQLARDYLERQARAGALEIRGDLGFVILHRCGADFYFLIVNTWRNENELWESVYAKNGKTAVDFDLFTFAGAHRGTYCVWELGAVWHEQQAWTRFLLSDRSEAAKRAYLDDRFNGPV